MSGRMRGPSGALRRDEDGSVLILALGYAALAVVLVLVTIDASSLYLARKHADTVADAAALAATDGFTVVVDGGAASARLDPDAIGALARQVVEATPDATLVSARSPDGLSARVTVATTWHPPVSTLFVPAGVRIEATATSRTLLR
ncbi:pilus assembly protein TadG-related protein [Microbacterium thalli]|uniref:Pilus assembly protein TadG-related protein n=1 Tax=Microbacterium thalli TaxID=3027921 RepID=A0ABT5SKS1_9MICO|nr:pilus assembly protein TadG-related protein [Microbacterium thalli]MDD7962627.1 pilus assembly protein TadG-related protein [Microbacterium thalli]